MTGSRHDTRHICPGSPPLAISATRRGRGPTSVDPDRLRRSRRRSPSPVPPAEAYAALGRIAATGGTGEHTYSGDAANLVHRAARRRLLLRDGCRPAAARSSICSIDLCAAGPDAAAIRAGWARSRPRRWSARLTWSLAAGRRRHRDRSDLCRRRLLSRMRRRTALRRRCVDKVTEPAARTTASRLDRRARADALSALRGG